MWRWAGAETWRHTCGSTRQTPRGCAWWRCWPTYAQPRRATYNARLDRAAAAAVVRNKLLRLVLVPTDATKHKGAPFVTRGSLDDHGPFASRAPLARLVNENLAAFVDAGIGGQEHRSYMHDPICVAAADGELAATASHRVAATDDGVIFEDADGRQVRVLRPGDAFPSASAFWEWLSQITTG